MDKYLDAILKILNPHLRDKEPASGDIGLAIGKVKGVDKARRQVTAVLSTPTIDRYGEVVLPRAFEKSLGQFMTNPKFLAGHAYGSRDGMPTSIGAWLDIKVSDSEVAGTAQFLDAGDALADAWWRRFEQGAVKTFSVGFIARKFEMRDITINGELRKVRHFTEAELLEVSAVEIPANPDAMVRQYGGVMLARGESLKAAEPIESIVRRVIREEIKATFNTEPGSELCGLIEDVVAAAQRSLAHGHQGDDDDDRAGVSGADELKAQLRRMLS